MNASTPVQKTSDKDRLISRPEGPLPTRFDPASRRARGYPRDPKLVPATGQGDPDATDPAPNDIGRSA
jgi:hypothetical protein